MDNINRTPKHGQENYLDSIVPREKRVEISHAAKWTAIALALISLLGKSKNIHSQTPLTILSIQTVLIHRGESHHLVREVFNSPFEGGSRGMCGDVHTPLPPSRGESLCPLG